MSVSVCVFAAVSRHSLLLLHAAVRECIWDCFINYPADKMIGQHSVVFFFHVIRLRPLNRCGQSGEKVSLLCVKLSRWLLSSRVDISDTLMYVYEMLGAELLSNLYDKLGRLLTNAEQPTSWQVGETQTRRAQKGTIF